MNDEEYEQMERDAASDAFNAFGSYLAEVGQFHVARLNEEQIRDGAWRFCQAWRDIVADRAR